MAAFHAILRSLAALGLAVDAAVHARLAGQYDAVTATISEGTLFRVEAGAAALAVVLVLVVRRFPGDLFAVLTAVAGLGAILVYRYVDLGAFGPFPDMYEPIWSTDKLWALAGQGLAIVALLPLLTAAARTRSTRPNGLG
ncbi:MULTISPECIES: hypothetical protein [Streptacidiphilus]|uniref:DoxX family protein n=1 Tax=Streptacidiphilus cavernicola TaxID=3342716 RepID=A0ABV6UVY5_9ACTN|nr:hypothetical protein [Streptacidiphilus jeojiense]